MTNIPKEAVEKLSRDCILARDCLKDTDTSQTGQSILDEAATALTALQARVTELESELTQWERSQHMASSGQEQMIDKCATVSPGLLDEPQAYKRACIRLGYELAICLVSAKETTPPQECE